jgi:hypothetical protein
MTPEVELRSFRPDGLGYNKALAPFSSSRFKVQRSKIRKSTFRALDLEPGTLNFEP